MKKRKRGSPASKEQLIKQLEETRKHLRKMAVMCFSKSLATSDPSESLEYEHEGRVYNNRARLAEETIRMLKSKE